MQHLIVSLFGDPNKRPIDLERDEAAQFVAYEDWAEVPYDDQIVLMDTAQKIFQEPLAQEEAVDYYNRAIQVWLGAPPSGPEEEVAFVRAHAEALTGRPLSDAELARYHARFLLSFLGR